MFEKNDDARVKLFADHGVRKDGYKWVPDFVYGGIDGAVTTFAVVAAVEGGGLALPVILIMGLANLLADGFSMAVGKFSSDRVAIQEYGKIKAMEFLHIEEKPEHEREEVQFILEKQYNFKGKDLERAVEVITADKDSWVDLLMRNKFNMTRENVSPLKGALATFISFLLIGSIPLVSYLMNEFVDFGDTNLFFVTCVFTLVALFIVGAIKGRVTDTSKFWGGLEVMAIAGSAAGISYYVGWLLRGLGA
ncbi:hypothetical protein CVV38_00385 [Candidatus Peregrinibacteria bacterium HGW-Peregrinibacteria-1]|jgi:VIT1/CCC1 family predicted Fe2+/Mn2+ transporter|nr:MAG: hypothetical protein CVV38_00385 [Candidatus Peregrinibacteria bacterium HGW-Peregrinibacteria-1]